MKVVRGASVGVRSVRGSGGGLRVWSPPGVSRVGAGAGRRCESLRQAERMFRTVRSDASAALI